MTTLNEKLGETMREELKTYLNFIDFVKVRKIVISNNEEKELNNFVKIVINDIGNKFQSEKYTQTQVFHENLLIDELEEYCINQLQMGFRQINVWDDDNEYSLRISKKKKIMFNKTKKFTPVNIIDGNNRKKQYILEEGQKIEPLIDMGIFTKDGKVINSMYDKYKQINKFIEIIDDTIKKMNLKTINIIDFGCGKSYLTFVVYYYFTEIRKIDTHIVGLDLKEDVIKKCNEAAIKYGYNNLHFEVGNINDYKAPFQIDMVITLHACDTATDFALFNAIKWNTKAIISVPCCQHELCGQLDSSELAIVQRYGIVKERCSALFTDAIRGNLLTYCGYKTQLLEFIDMEHTPKNILIRAVKSNIAKEHKEKVLKEVEKLNECFDLRPTLYELLIKGNHIE